MINIVESKSVKAVGTNSLKVSFEYSPEIISAIKNVGNTIWNPKEKYWEVPCSKLAELVDKLTLLDDIILNILPDESKDELQLTINYKTTPFKHQLEGVKWIINRNHGLVLDAPGVGKTLQITYAAEELKAQKGIEHCLVICGINTLKENWEKEISKHSDESCVIIGKKITKKGTITYASTKERAEQLYNKLDQFFVIINIESLRNSLVVDAIINSKNKFDMIVLDECHKCATPTSAQSKGLLKLSKVGRYHYGLTGTLLTNTVLNAYVPLKFIGEEKSNFSNFKAYYCNYEYKFGHNQINGFKNVDILKEQLETCSIRRSKDILDLPPKIIIPEIIELSEDQLKFYNDIQAGCVEEADRVNIKTTSLLGLITRLRQAATCPSSLSTTITESAKIERAVELAEEIMSNNEKVVIFSTFKDPINILAELLKKYKPLLGTGDIPNEEVSKNIDMFQEDDEHKLFLATTQKCGTGITLNRACYGIFIDSTWTAALETQVQDRLYRIGTNRTVFIYRLIAKDTIDERIQIILERKQAISDYVIDSKETEDAELRELLGI